ncbi:MAG TPA: hypothetical protein VM534_07650 [Thermoanaerobaculia bacterium]|nr:hypothetical protein [Thermoanaerobaculia bacterium]
MKGGDSWRPAPLIPETVLITGALLLVIGASRSANLLLFVELWPIALIAIGLEGVRQGDSGGRSMTVLAIGTLFFLIRLVFSTTLAGGLSIILILIGIVLVFRALPDERREEKA